MAKKVDKISYVFLTVKAYTYCCTYVALIMRTWNYTCAYVLPFFIEDMCIRVLMLVCYLTVNTGTYCCTYNMLFHCEDINYACCLWQVTWKCFIAAISNVKRTIIKRLMCRVVFLLVYLQVLFTKYTSNFNEIFSKMTMFQTALSLTADLFMRSHFTGLALLAYACF